MDRHQLINLLSSEYAYWRDAQGDDIEGVRMGAMGAVANVLAAIAGHPAPWHKAPAQVPAPARTQPEEMEI
jgi:hypothetical protein